MSRYQDNDINNAGSAAIAEALGDNKAITALNLGMNSIGHGAAKGSGSQGGALDIAAAIAVDGSQLVSLNLGSNRLGRGGARAIAKALAVNQSLTKLSLANNAVMEYGAVQLTSLIRNGTALKQLNLSMNKVGDRGAAALATALLDTPGALTILNLRNNFVGDGAAGEFAVLLRRRQILTELDLSCNVITDVGARGIVGAFRANASLRVFACENNRFTDPRVFRALEAALQLDTAHDEKVKVGPKVDHEDDFLHDIQYAEAQWGSPR